MKRKVLLLAVMNLSLIMFSCKKEISEDEKISGLWYVRIIAEQQINEKGVLAFKSYTEYKLGNYEVYATFNFQNNRVFSEEKNQFTNGVIRKEYTYSIEGNDLILIPISTSENNEVYKMSYLGMKNSLILDRTQMDAKNKPFNLKKVLVRTLPKPDPAIEEIGSEPNQGTPTEGG